MVSCLPMRFRFLALWCLPALLCAEEPLKSDTRELESFETDRPGITAKDAGYAATTEGVTSGARALRLSFHTPASYPAVVFPFESPQDFRGYGGLAFDVYNPGRNTVAFNTRIDSSKDADGGGNHSRTGAGRSTAGSRPHLSSLSARTRDSEGQGAAGVRGISQRWLAGEGTI